MVIRIQPAVSDPDAARALVTLLSQLPDSEPLPPAVDSGQLLDTLARRAEEAPAELPEVVLVHELIGPVPALELIGRVALRFPAVGVVLLTQDTSPRLYSAAMDAGARGVAALPLAYDEVEARVGAAAAWARGVRRHLGGGFDDGWGPAGPGPGGEAGTVVTVAGAKGGVGTTLTAVQLALAARASGRETALVDLDLQAGDVASFLDVRFRRSVADLAGITDLSPRVLQDAVYAHETGLGLLLAPAEGERGEEVDERAARQLVAALRARYEVVVVDCGTQMNAGNTAAIETADTALLVTTPDVVAVRGATRMVRLWDRLQIRTAEETVIVVNRTSRHTEIQPRLIARITGTPVARTTVPAHFKELQSALDAGRLQDLDAKGSVRQALWRLAGELGLVAGAEPEAGSGARARRGVARRRGRGPSGEAGKGTARRGALAAQPERQALPRGTSPSSPAAGSAPATGPAPSAGGSSPPGAGPYRPSAPGAYPDTGHASGPYPDPADPSRPYPGATDASGAHPDVAHAPGPYPDPTDASGPYPDPRDAPGPYPDAPRTPGPYPDGTTYVAGPDAAAGGAAGTGAFAVRPERDANGSPRRRFPPHGGEGGDRGALSVEFAGMAPVVLLTLVLLWQCVLIGYTFSLAGNSADEAARAATAAAAYGDAQGACESAARAHLPAKWREDARISCTRGGTVWKADVDLRTPLLFPGAAGLPFTVGGEAGAAVEG
ncbi:AAA family ATPase [Streptomyces albus]|uniref:AAA family ATPase n=1 Tax=Streptomyces albus TaxID=1888 RepID=UPI0033E60AE1